jgi:hypothetical protein
LDASGYGYDSDIIAALNWVMDPDGDNTTDDGADVISMSLGGPYADLDSPLVYAVREAISMGAVVVVAAGNCGEECPGSKCNGYIGVETPGIVPEAVTVGAVDKSNYWACFSSGGLINNSYIKPDLVAPGVLISSSVPGGYDAWSGTSMSAPHVAGAAALLLQSNPGLSPSDVKYILERTAMHLGEPGKDVKYGSGLIDLSNLLPSNVNKILKYRVDFEKAVYQMDALQISVNDTLGTALKMTAALRDPAGTIFTLNFTETSEDSWLAFFGETGHLGTYNINITILELEGNEVVISDRFDVIRYTLTSGMIKDVVIPAEIGYNETLPVTVVFENNGNQSMDVIIEAQIWDETLIAAEETYGSVDANSTEMFNLSWKAVAPLGPKIMKVIASFNESYHERSRTFAITDNSAPIILSVTGPEELTENGPLIVTAKVLDTGNITSASLIFGDSMEVNEYSAGMEEIVRVENLHILSGAIEGPFAVGGYTLNVTVCDPNGCGQHLHHDVRVNTCDMRSILVVSEDASSEPERWSGNAANGTYCFSLWEERVAGAPSLSYLRNFSAAIWTTGNYLGSGISNEAAAVLESYVDGGGRLLIEGPDIASNHRYDEAFMEVVLRSEFGDDLAYAENDTVTLLKTRFHPLLEGLPEVIPYNATLSPYPDSVRPMDGSREIMSWGDAGSAIIVWNDGGSKVMFVPFMMQALGEENQDKMISNALEWLTRENNGMDLAAGPVLFDHPWEGENTGVMLSLNMGTEDADAYGVRIDVLVDGSHAITVTEDLPTRATKRQLINLTLAEGNHVVTAVVNPDVKYEEDNYINNVFDMELYVYPGYLDLAVKDIEYEITSGVASVTVVTENLGGFHAINSTVSLYADGELVDREFVHYIGGTVSDNSFTIRGGMGITELVAVVESPDNMTETNYENNNASEELRWCDRFSVLVISDSDTSDYSTPEPDSSVLISDVLADNGYCVKRWNISEKGPPEPGLMNSFDLLIWSSGDYWGDILDPDEELVLNQYLGNIIFEGSDIAFAHNNDTFMTEKLHSILDSDLILYNETNLTLTDHDIFSGITGIRLNSTLCPFPDSLMPIDGFGAAEWPEGGYAVITYNNSRERIVYFAFSIDCIEPSARGRLIKNAVNWTFVLKGDANFDNTVNLFDLALVGKSYGTKEGEQGWNPDVDMNGDGKISIMDLATVGWHYGRSY